MSDEEKLMWITLHENHIKNSFAQIKRDESINICYSNQDKNVIDILTDYEAVKQRYEWFLENNYVKEIDGKYVVLII